MTTRGTILVTPRSVTRGGHRSLDRLRDTGFELRFSPPGEVPSAAVLLQLLPGCVGYLAGVEPVSATVLRAAAGLRVIARNGTGIDNIDLTTANELGIRICRAEGANARGVAELTLGLILSAARSIPRSDRAIKLGQWERTTGFELEGKTLGLIGCGRIGKLVAGFALALGMRVVAHDAAPDRAFRPSTAFTLLDTVDQVLSEADVVSLHCPPASGGAAIIDAAAIRCMKRGTILINTARAELVDRDALHSAIREGQIGGYGVDVYVTEPPGHDELLVQDAVVATPHAGGLTRESVDRAMHVAVDNLLSALRA